MTPVVTLHRKRPLRTLQTDMLGSLRQRLSWSPTKPSPQPQSSSSVGDINDESVTCAADHEPSVWGYLDVEDRKGRVTGGLPITERDFTMGRSSDNDVRVCEIGVSRHACRISFIKPGQASIELLGSNKVIVNGTVIAPPQDREPQAPLLLSSQDSIVLVKYRFRFRYNETATSSSSERVFAPMSPADRRKSSQALATPSGQRRRVRMSLVRTATIDTPVKASETAIQFEAIDGARQQKVKKDGAVFKSSSASDLRVKGRASAAHGPHTPIRPSRDAVPSTEPRSHRYETNASIIEVTSMGLDAFGAAGQPEERYGEGPTSERIEEEEEEQEHIVVMHEPEEPKETKASSDSQMEERDCQSAPTTPTKKAKRRSSFFGRAWPFGSSSQDFYAEERDEPKHADTSTLDEPDAEHDARQEEAEESQTEQMLSVEDERPRFPRSMSSPGRIGSPSFHLHGKRNASLRTKTLIRSSAALAEQLWAEANRSEVEPECQGSAFDVVDEEQQDILIQDQRVDLEEEQGHCHGEDGQEDGDVDMHDEEMAEAEDIDPLSASTSQPRLALESTPTPPESPLLAPIGSASQEPSSLELTQENQDGNDDDDEDEIDRSLSSIGPLPQDLPPKPTERAHKRMSLPATVKRRSFGLLPIIRSSKEAEDAVTARSVRAEQVRTEEPVQTVSHDALKAPARDALRYLLNKKPRTSDPEEKSEASGPDAPPAPKYGMLRELMLGRPESSMVFDQSKQTKRRSLLLAGPRPSSAASMSPEPQPTEPAKAEPERPVMEQESPDIAFLRHVFRLDTSVTDRDTPLRELRALLEDFEEDLLAEGRLSEDAEADLLDELAIPGTYRAMLAAAGSIARMSSDETALQAAAYITAPRPEGEGPPQRPLRANGEYKKTRRGCRGGRRSKSSGPNAMEMFEQQLLNASEIENDKIESAAEARPLSNAQVELQSGSRPSSALGVSGKGHLGPLAASSSPPSTPVKVTNRARPASQKPFADAPEASTRKSAVRNAAVQESEASSGKPVLRSSRKANQQNSEADDTEVVTSSPSKSAASNRRKAAADATEVLAPTRAEKTGRSQQQAGKQDAQNGKKGRAERRVSMRPDEETTSTTVEVDRSGRSSRHARTRSRGVVDGTTQGESEHNEREPEPSKPIAKGRSARNTRAKGAPAAAVNETDDEVASSDAVRPPSSPVKQSRRKAASSPVKASSRSRSAAAEEPARTRGAAGRGGRGTKKNGDVDENGGAQEENNVKVTTMSSPPATRTRSGRAVRKVTRA
ncbi:unnamed protein product [Jaminaea pallidilutea]